MERKVRKRLWEYFRGRYQTYNKSSSQSLASLYFSSFVESDTVYLANVRYVTTKKLFADGLNLEAYETVVGESRVSLLNFLTEYLEWYQEKAQARCRASYPTFDDEYEIVNTIRAEYETFANEYRELFDARTGINMAIENFRALIAGLSCAEVRNVYACDAEMLRNDVAALQYQSLLIAEEARDAAYLVSSLNRARTSEILVYNKLVKRWTSGMYGVTSSMGNVRAEVQSMSADLQPLTQMDAARVASAQREMAQIVAVLERAIVSRERFVKRSSELLRRITDNARIGKRIDEINYACQQEIAGEVSRVCRLAGDVYLSVYVASATLSDQGSGARVPTPALEELLPPQLVLHYKTWASPNAISRLYSIYPSRKALSRVLRELFEIVDKFEIQHTLRKTFPANNEHEERVTQRVAQTLVQRFSQ